MVRATGLEPARKPLEPKSNVSTNSTMPAYSVNSGEWTAESYCFAVLMIAVSIFSNSLQSLEHKGRFETTEKVVFLSHYSQVVTVKLYELE